MELPAAARRAGPARCAASPTQRHRPVSDGLLGDLGHVLRRSGVGARLRRRCAAAQRGAGRAAAGAAARVPAARRRRLRAAVHAPRRRGATRCCAAARDAGVPVTRIGRIEAGRGAASWSTAHGQALAATARGFDHFEHERACRDPPPTPRQRRADCALHARAPGALDRAGLRQRPVAARARHRRHAVGLGRRSWCSTAGSATLHWALLLVASACCSAVWACTAAPRAPGRGRPGRDRLGRDRRLLGRAVAGHAGRLAGRSCWPSRCSASSMPPSPARWAGPTGCFKLRAAAARIGWAQGFGILFDDLVAAACTLLVMALWRPLWS